MVSLRIATAGFRPALQLLIPDFGLAVVILVSMTFSFESRPLVGRELAIDVCRSRIRSALAPVRVSASLSSDGYGLLAFLLRFVCGYSALHLPSFRGCDFSHIRRHGVWLVAPPRAAPFNHPLLLPRMVDPPFADTLTLLFECLDDRGYAGAAWPLFPVITPDTHSRRIRNLLRQHGVAVTLASAPRLVLVPGPWGPVVQARQTVASLGGVIETDEHLLPVAGAVSSMVILGGPASSPSALGSWDSGDVGSDSSSLRLDLDDAGLNGLAGPVGPAPPSPFSFSAWFCRLFPPGYGTFLAADYLVALLAFFLFIIVPGLMTVDRAALFASVLFVTLAALDTSDWFFDRRLSLWSRRR